MTEFVVFKDENGEIQRFSPEDDAVDDIDMVKDYNAVRVEKGKQALYVPLERVFRVQVQQDEYQ
ncbi:MAG: hypothetical protein SVU32_06485 [Candidatus Nanohaloarchaea archaeon]|nr:hypothetical protein [Candidatus Nanohaloarchaea archaeon]